MDTLKCYVVILAVLCDSVFSPISRNANNSNLKKKRKCVFFAREHINISVGNEPPQHKISINLTTCDLYGCSL